jgi:hypothetical protein
MNEEILKNINQPLNFLAEKVDKAKILYNSKILKNKLTREMHTELHILLQEILNWLKVLANRLGNYDYKDDLLNIIAHGYSHEKNISFQYFYEGGEYICDCNDVPPFYSSKIIQTFDPEKEINKEIEKINIVIYKQKKSHTEKSADNELIYELNELFIKINRISEKIKEKFSLELY